MSPHSLTVKHLRLVDKKGKGKIAQTLTALTKQEILKQKNEALKSVLKDKFRGFLIRNNKAVRNNTGVYKY